MVLGGGGVMFWIIIIIAVFAFGYKVGKEDK
jgi:hypothetical protein